MAITILSITGSIAIALLIYPIINLTQNYLRVRPVGLPVLVSPFGRLNPLWIITQPYLSPILHWVSSLGGPFKIFNWIEYSTKEWFFFSRYELHLIHGPVFFIVSPAGTQLIVADPATADKIQTRRKDFIKNPSLYEQL
jgi:hypothetical protein